jgi:putative PIN family toxin of toxin-antitoxin system
MPKSKRIKVIIDTNLFISFLIGKQLKSLKELLIDSRIKLIFAEQNIQELKIVSQRPKFNKYFNVDKLDDLIDLIYIIGQVFIIDSIPNVCHDPKDNFLLELALKGRADFLVTGDKDLLNLNSYKGTKIITPKEFERTMKSGKT